LQPLQRALDRRIAIEAEFAEIRTECRSASTAQHEALTNEKYDWIRFRSKHVPATHMGRRDVICYSTILVQRISRPF